MRRVRQLAVAFTVFAALAPAGLSQEACAVTEQQRVIADDWKKDARNGTSVALSGDTLVSGAWRDDHSGLTAAGAAYVFVRSGTDWDQQAKLISSAPLNNGRFGTTVAISGEVAVVGDVRNDAACVFERSGSTWSELSTVTGPNNFGTRVALEGDTLAVSVGGPQSEISIFVRSGTDWNHEADLPLGGYFDHGLSISGDTVLANVDGLVRVFVRSGTSWSEQAQLPGALLNGTFVAVRGDRAVIGAPLEASNTGAAHVYERVGSAWSLAATLHASDGTGGDFFGQTVALTDGRIVIGATQATLPLAGGGFAFDTGAAYSFVPGVLGWVEQSKLVASAPINFEDFATSLAVDGDHVAAGAPYAYIPPSGGRAGAIYVFDLADHEPVSYCTAGISASGCQATLTSLGVASASAPTGFVVGAAGVEGDKSGLFYFGTAGRIGNPWGTTSSFKCVSLPAARGALLFSGGTSGACDGAFNDDLNARWRAKPAQNPGAGAVVQVQLWYRDPFNPGNKATSYSDALELTVCP